ncbi:MAG: GNAT family N-acetyltransferase [Chloroflexi bacterium]|nr:GNAT family N-acetyltransferase [Chloroflexota bacterium]
MIQTPDIAIRPMRSEEKIEVQTMMREAFSPIQQVFFTWTPDVLIAESAGNLVGAILLKLYPLPGKRQGGAVSTVFTRPDARGTGVGRSLVAAALDFFEAHHCDEITACLEGYDSNCSKLFSSQGFSILSPGDQFTRYGWGVFLIWARIFHVIDFGHFIWARPGTAQSGATLPGTTLLDRLSRPWWGTVLANTLIVLLAMWGSRDYRIFPPVSLLAMPVLVTAFLGLRWLAMSGAAEVQGLEVQFRPWESGFPLSILVALVIHDFLPVPGNLYPALQEWKYRDLLPKLNWMALAGIIPVMILTWVMWGLLQIGNLPLEVARWVIFTFYIGRRLAFFDTILIFYPFTGFNGRRVWDWDRRVWAVLAVIALIGFLI